MRKPRLLNPSVVLLTLLVLSGGCVTRDPGRRVNNRLSPERRALFSDSFDTIRRDHWDLAGLVYSETQLEHFKLAEPRIRDGRLVLETATDAFSKGGLASTFLLRGDFDIQIDCRMDFPDTLQLMDWIAVFGVFEEGGRIGDTAGVQTGLVRRKLSIKTFLFSNHLVGGKKHQGGFSRIEDFDGTLRLVRQRDRVFVLYREKGNAEWTELGAHPFTERDAFVGFKVQNFLASRTIVQGSSSVIAVFDEFRINAAEGIVESEI